MKICKVVGCGLAADGYGTLCGRHKRAQQRHGHPEQVGVTLGELGPYLKRVRARIKKNADSPAWSLLQARWEAVAAAAREAEESYRTGIPFHHYQRQAEAEVRRLAEECSPRQVMEMALALYLLQEEQPKRFKSDNAFSFQLARRVRCLTETNAGTHWCHKEGRVKKVYRDIPPRTLVILAEHIKAACGVAGLHIARLEREEATRKAQERQALDNALGGLV